MSPGKLVVSQLVAGAECHVACVAVEPLEGNGRFSLLFGRLRCSLWPADYGIITTVLESPCSFDGVDFVSREIVIDASKTFADGEMRAASIVLQGVDIPRAELGHGIVFLRDHGPEDDGESSLNDEQEATKEWYLVRLWDRHPAENASMRDLVPVIHSTLDMQREYFKPSVLPQSSNNAAPLVLAGTDIDLWSTCELLKHEQVDTESLDDLCWQGLEVCNRRWRC